jgi:transposase
VTCGMTRIQDAGRYKSLIASEIELREGLATLLVDRAKKSASSRKGLISAENELECLHEEYAMLMRQHDAAMALHTEVLMQILGVFQILEVKGIGLITAADFIAEVGDINRFEYPKQIQKLAGLNLKEDSSGKHKAAFRRCTLF